MTPSNRYFRGGLRVLLAFGLAVFVTGSSKAHADAAACIDLVQKIEAANRFATGGHFIYTTLVGGAVRTRSEEPSAFHDFFMADSHDLATAPIPSLTASRRSAAEVVLGSGVLSSVVREEFPGRDGPATDRTQIRVLRSGAVTVQSLKWNNDVFTLDNVDCVKLETVPATNGATSLPVVLITGRKTFPGYGTDVYQFVIRPSWSYFG
jgi:hypothetical protein